MEFSSNHPHHQIKLREDYLYHFQYILEFFSSEGLSAKFLTKSWGFMLFQLPTRLLFCSDLSKDFVEIESDQNSISEILGTAEFNVNDLDDEILTSL